MTVPLVMAILNVTPDSFSDGGVHVADPVGDALRMIDEGADLVDVGGESTRPGAEPVDEEEELRRTIPVVAALAGRGVRVSIDTTKQRVAREAIAAGATFVNDVNGGLADGMLETVAAGGAAIALMHRRGDPKTMQIDPRYDDVVAEVHGFLAEREAVARAAGISEVWVDPGIGFGKTDAHHLALLRALPSLCARHRVLLGVSRKGFLGRIASSGPDPSARLAAGLTVALHGAACGVGMLRVHDVADTVRALRVQAWLED